MQIIMWRNKKRLPILVFLINLLFMINGQRTNREIEKDDINLMDQIQINTFDKTISSMETILKVINTKLVENQMRLRLFEEKFGSIANRVIATQLQQKEIQNLIFELDKKHHDNFSAIKEHIIQIKSKLEEILIEQNNYKSNYNCDCKNSEKIVSKDSESTNRNDEVLIQRLIRAYKNTQIENQEMLIKTLSGQNELLISVLNSMNDKLNGCSLKILINPVAESDSVSEKIDSISNSVIRDSNKNSWMNDEPHTLSSTATSAPNNSSDSALDDSSSEWKTNEFLCPQTIAESIKNHTLPKCNTNDTHFHCHHDDDDHWIVIMHRSNELLNESFNKTWSDYKYGFGIFMQTDFWIGNEFIHHITTSDKLFKLYIKIQNNIGEIKYAQYTNFWLKSEDDMYAIRVCGYQGTAGDSFRFTHNFRPFLTYDKPNLPNKVRSKNFPAYYGNGWWYSDFSRQTSNLNGLFSSNNTFWKSWSDLGSPDSVMMMISEIELCMCPHKNYKC